MHLWRQVLFQLDPDLVLELLHRESLLWCGWDHKSPCIAIPGCCIDGGSEVIGFLGSGDTTFPRAAISKRSSEITLKVRTNWFPCSALTGYMPPPLPPLEITSGKRWTSAIVFGI